MCTCSYVSSYLFATKKKKIDSKMKGCKFVDYTSFETNTMSRLGFQIKF
jgi:hypothetical protein